ncbi:MAG: hypothetical protein KBT30_01430 [Clostridiales bacterium]|nr:hypothetical protein [Candidatus Apopatousia equi]
MLDLLEEIEITNKEVEKDELNFNFNGKLETKEEAKPNVSGIENVDLTKNVKVILFLINNDSFKSKEKSYNLTVCGKPMKDWVKNAVKDFSTLEVEISNNDDFLSKAKAHLDENYKYTLVLFSDTPLLKQKTVVDVLEYFVIKQLSCLKVSRGYVFETSYLKQVEKLYNPQLQYFEEEDFITCFNLKQYALISDIMKNRIISYHQKQGVRFTDVSSVIIDADVSIESDVLIKSGNKIFGNTIIETGAIISENNLIDNSVIMQNSKVENSTIKNSIVGKNCIVENYCTVKNKSVIGDNSILMGYNYVDNKKLARDTKLSPYEK